MAFEEEFVDGSEPLKISDEDAEESDDDKPIKIAKVKKDLEKQKRSAEGVLATLKRKLEEDKGPPSRTSAQRRPSLRRS